MFQLPLAFQPVVERLAGIVVALAVALEETPVCLREHNRVLTSTRNADGLDEPLLAEMSEVA